MGLNLSRGDAIKYYSSDRITQIIGNGLVCLIDEKTQYNNFFNSNEMVFYKNVSDLSEKIIKISKDEKLRKKIAMNGKKKYMKYFNSDLVAQYIINKTLDVKIKTKNFWEKIMFSIIIPTYNNLDYLKLCLKSIKDNSSFNHEIIVHVNEGTDGTKSFLEKINHKFTYSDK